MGDYCDLRNANGDADARCDGEACPFWRLVEHVGDPEGSGCAVKHYRLLGDERVAGWLVSVRERLERLERHDNAGGVG
jgi:hypothetical protein